MAWQLRVAGVADLDDIMAIETPTFGTDAWSASAMASDLQSAHTYYLVAFHPETPTLVEGYAGLLAPRRSADADIQTIAVAASARRQGLGRVLMQALIAEARDRGARSVFLEVRADNPGAQKLYDELGFEQIAVRPQYYQPDGVDAHIMKLTVTPASLSPAVGA
ncbi:ribosomal protein S18-alanine N-acetyltransferase [Glaciihabitans sp. dw_435]|uniref:ribosomal protein S18-alanine N-acetyltransferase n=1 Tax=Glaciihabitans sp. dw_435 TaxID=2720081 RepID=UPI001BD1C01D|nr:ribosomal protein S18-alanine N-acetyltransferase [Glaciihabitans sp. dw_435]